MSFQFRERLGILSCPAAHRVVCIGVAVVAAAVALLSNSAEALPPNFADTPIADNWVQAVGICFAPDGRMFVWEKAGRVWNVENGVKSASPLLDISEEVGDWEDYGMLGFAIDPDFYNNGYIYASYVVDYHHLMNFGTPSYDPQVSTPYKDTIGRITRYTCNPGDGFRSVNYGSRLVLLGEAVNTGIPICGVTHGVGTLLFGADGSLIASCGDGASHIGVDKGGPTSVSSNTALADGIITQTEDVGSYRSQLVNSLNGKILRLDPATGDGLPSNPFFDVGAPRAPRSRVWALGLRNPYRITMRPGTGDPNPANGDPGTFYIGDVGWYGVEDFSICTGPGQNFGWPIFEGLEPTVEYELQHVQNRDAPNPLFGTTPPGQGPCNRQFFNFDELCIQESLNPPSFPNPCDPSQQIPAGLHRFVHRRPAIDWVHTNGPSRCGIFSGNNAAVIDVGAPGAPVLGPQFGGSTSIGGVWYTADDVPPQYQNTYFHADFSGRWIKQFIFDAQDQPVEIRNFGGSEVGAVVAIATNPVSGGLYYINYDQMGESAVREIRWLDNLPPAAIASADVYYGPSPLTVQFTGSTSSDPESGPLRFVWDFDDGTPYSTRPDPLHTFGTEEDITAAGTIVARIFSMTPPYPVGGGNFDPEVIRDGDYPPANSQDDLRQFDTFHWGEQGNVDWIGYTFAQPREFRRVLFQEGTEYADGGWWAAFTLQYQSGGSWINVPGAVVTPVYTANDGICCQMYEFTLPPITGTGIRIHGDPGGSLDFMSVAELRVVATSTTPVVGPTQHDVRMTVTDNALLTANVQMIVSMNNTPPQIAITSPVNGMLYPADCGAGHPQAASFADPGSDPSQESADPSPFPDAIGSEARRIGPRDAQIILPLTADITDAEHAPGQIACKWQTIFHHNEHTHPGPISSNCSATAVVTPSGCDGETYYYEFKLTATDAHGLAATQSVYAYPDCFADFDFSLNTDDTDLAEWRECFTGPLVVRSRHGGCGPDCTCQPGVNGCPACGPDCTCASSQGGGFPGGEPDVCLDADTDADNDIDCDDWPAFLAAYQCSTHHLPLMAITEFVNALLDAPTNPSDMCVADLNGDGKADGEDIEPFVQALIAP